MSRLFVEQPLESGIERQLTGESAHYVARVLRLKTGDALTLFDGRGGEYCATVSAVSKKGVVVSVGGHSDRERESPLSVHLVQAISRRERMDFVIQKATELGVMRLTPVVTEFSVVKLRDGKGDKRLRHWMGIARSACEQCGRNRVPVIEQPRTYEEWLRGLAPAGRRLRLLLQPCASARLGDVTSKPAGVDLLIGPEGGLSVGEAADARAAGFLATGFGPRTLRTETAAIAAIAAFQTLWGDLG